MADYKMSGLSINRANNVVTLSWVWGPDVTPSKHQA